MRITATQNKLIDVEIDDFTLKDIIITEICEVFNLQKDAYIKDGKLMYEKRHGGGTMPVWYETVNIRDTVDTDAAALLVIQKIQKEL